jgi:hypothetical protein
MAQAIKIFNEKELKELIFHDNSTLLKETENFAIFGIKYKSKSKSRFFEDNFQTLTLILTHKRNIADIVASYVIYDMKDTKGLMIVNRYKQTEIHKIAYTLQQGIQEQQELENYAVVCGDSVKNKEGK